MVKFKMTVPRRSPTMRAQYMAMHVPILGYLPKYPLGLVKSLRKIRQLYQIRNKKLRAAGCEGLKGRKYTYAYNCPPCSVKLEPWSQPCGWSWCPFCYARRVQDLYLQVRALTQQGSYTIATVRHKRGYHADSRRSINFDAEGTLASSVADIVAEQRPFAKGLRNGLFADAIGGYHWHTISPDTRRKEHKDAPGVEKKFQYLYDTDDGTSGRWLTIHGTLAVMPLRWTTDAEHVYTIDNPSAHALATVVGQTFRYPLGWLYSDPVVMAEYLNNVKRTRFLNPWGRFSRAIDAN